MNTARKVMISEYKRQPDNKFKLVEKGVALFHAFGTRYEEFDTGAGNYSTAIVEWADGTMGNVPVEHVRFLDVL
jgi:hypothetical protein